MGALLADSLEDAARVLGGELERFEDETVIWFPEEEFHETWGNDQGTLVVKLSGDKIPKKLDLDFVEYRWRNIVIPPDGAYPVPNGEGTKKGFAINEIPLLVEA